MGKKTAVMPLLKVFKSKLAKNMPVSRILLFGSRATGKAHRYSDIDLLIISRNFADSNFRQRATKMYDYWDADYPVDFICYTPREFNALKRRGSIIVREALKDGVEV